MTGIASGWVMSSTDMPSVVWLRAADLVVLTVKAGAVRVQEGRDVLDALRAAGRVTDELLQEYLKELS